MLTLTVRHDRWASLAELEEGCRQAWRFFWAGGRLSMRARKLLGVEHYVKAIEHTHGPNGWHPHFHLVVVRREGHVVTQDQRAELAELWQECVRLAMGSRYEPTRENGLKVTQLSSDTYIAKMGLEIAGITSKEARADGHRTSWQVAQAAATGDARSRILWKEYTHATHGTRLMTWSRGTKKLLGIEERTDLELLEEEAAELEREPWVIASFDGDTWDSILRRRLEVRVVQAATDGDVAELERLGGHVATPVPPN